MAFVHTKLAEANQALASGDLEASVLALVELWAKLPSTRIANVVLKLSSRLSHQELPSKVADREAEWSVLAATADPKIVPTLLSVEWPVHPRGVKARIEQLQKFSPDPRLAHALRELWLGGRYRSQAGGVFWRRAFRLLLNWKDPQATALIDAAKSTDDGYFIVKPIIDKRTKTPLPTEPALDANITRGIDELEAAAGIQAGAVAMGMGAASKESLFQAVYDDVSSDAPRLVLADFLLQEGDLRGELIQLMHAVESGRGTSKAETRIRSLLRASGKKWLDGIGSMVEEDHHFRCGFASEVTLRWGVRVDPSIDGWRTITTLHLGAGRGEQITQMGDALVHPNFRAVTSVDGLPMSEIVRLDDKLAGRSFDRLGLTAEAGDLTEMPKSKLGGVRHLGIARAENVPLDANAVLAWFDASAFRQTSDPPKMRTEVLEITALETGVPRACAYLEVRPSSLEEIWLRPSFWLSSWETRISRDPESGKPSVLEVLWHGRNSRARETGAMGQMIRRLARNVLTRVTLRATTRMSPGGRRDLAHDIRMALEATQPNAKFDTAFEE